jgi:hypothetical protein
MTDATEVTFRLALLKRDPDLLADTAKALTDIGFDVNFDGSRGLMLTGPKSLAEQIFSSNIEVDDVAPRFEEEPRTNLLPDSVKYTVYFPSKPTSF